MQPLKLLADALAPLEPEALDELLGAWAHADIDSANAPIRAGTNTDFFTNTLLGLHAPDGRVPGMSTVPRLPGPGDVPPPTPEVSLPGCNRYGHTPLSELVTGHVHAPYVAQRIADLANGGGGLQRLLHRVQHVAVALSGAT